MMQAAVTDGTIALRNLDAQIHGLECAAEQSGVRVEERVRLIELLVLRGSTLGAVAMHERARTLADALVGDAATSAASYVARARTRAVFHRFVGALQDLGVAEQLGGDAEIVNRERAAVFQGLGRYEEALRLRDEAHRRSPGFDSLAALAMLHGESGDAGRAQRLHDESLRLYRGVSPFALALLAFQMGVVWMHEGNLDRARDHLSAAQGYLPAYVPARGHLAEVEAERGNANAAVALLYPLATTSDDPDYAGQLARVLADAGITRESRHWRRHAAKRYDELIELHPEAFADHAADFWLSVGADPEKALRLARMNLASRNTPRARVLLSRAVAACEAASARGSLEPGLSQSSHLQTRGTCNEHPDLRSSEALFQLIQGQVFERMSFMPATRR
jgi:tetratricopeptide (TPR) repeat protein